MDSMDKSMLGWISRQGLFFRLALLVMMPLALLGLAAVVNAQKEYANAELAALAKASALAHQAAARLDEYYDDLDQFLTAVAEVARDTLTRGADGDPALARMLHALPQHVTGLSILSLDGRMLSSTMAAPEVRASINVADRGYFKDSLVGRRLVVSEPQYSSTTNQWVSVSARPVYDDVGRAIGAVSTSARLERVHTILVPNGLPLGALMTVFNDRGVGIASTAEPLAAVGRDFLKSDTIRRALRDRTFNAKAPASDGRVRLAAYASGEKLPWMVEVALDWDGETAPARQQLWQRLLLLAMALGLGLVIAAFLARRVGQPLRVLVQDADALGAGNLARRTAAAGYREVNQLGAAFDRMADAVATQRSALKAGEQRFRALTALSSDWYWEQDADFRFTSVGSDDPNWALPMLGKKRWELNGEPLAQSWEDHKAQLERHETFRDVVFRYTAVHGATAYLSVSGEPVFDEAGTFCGYRGTATSVTERYRLQQELQERMELLRVTLDTAPVAIGLIRTRDNTALLANRAAHELLGVNPGQREWNVLDYWARREDAREVKRRLERDGYVRDMEAPIRVPGRESVWALVSARPARYSGEDVTVATLSDISERKALEAQREALLADLRGANERLRRLSAQVLDAQEAERRQIAHELHDEIGQNLSALKLFAGHLRSSAAPALHAQIDEWIAVVDTSLAQLRDLSRLLRPVQLDHMGLVPALRGLLETQARAAGWLTQFEATGSEARFDTRIETVCYRVAQEALTNAARHASAATLKLGVHRGAHEITLEIEDDGRGFDIAEARSRIQQGRSMGLLGMEERVRLAGGRLDVDSAPARGTRLTAVIPLVPEPL